MKRLVLIIFAILSLVTLQAQTSDGYLTDKDIVSISVEINENGVKRYYLEASADGILTQSYATANCLWELGISENNGVYHYTLKNLTSDKYIYIDANPSNPTYSLQNTATTFTLEREAGAQGTYETGKLYYRFYYSPWNSWQTVYFAQGGWWPFRFTLSTGNEVTVQIEKWNKEGADTPGGGFYPETLIFPYASNDSEAQAQNQEVTFTIPETAVVSYQCVNRPDEIIGGGQNDVDERDITDFRLYWESSNTTTSEIKRSNYYTPNPSDGYVLPEEGTDVLTLTEGASAGTNKTHTFTITPVGKSPMNLRTNTNNRTQWVNYADRVVAEYKYKGNTVKQTMRVVRNSYHEEPLPPLTFHVNPTMFTFGAQKETVNITVVPIHQHGSVIYDVNQNVFTTKYEDPAYPEQLTLTSETDGWEITTDDGADWLSHTVNDNSITITAEALGNGQSDRTATFTGIFKRENAGSGHNHQESFTIQLAQRSDAGIQFHKKNQEVHTATRTIYYLPEDRIELRLAESNFFGYMRWYDYHTDKAPNYNFGNNDPIYGNYDYATSWYTTPRGANNQPFTPINTPASATTESTEGRSWGLYAINHHHGGILNEGTENSNNTPVLNGWDYTYTKRQTYSTEQAKRAAGYHTIACDVSAYTDYVITKDDKTGLVNSITEPTLSYRQLFDLRPAGEMADTLAARTSRGVYLEEYHYQAPAGKNILLTPQFKYRKGTNEEFLSKLCYFYWNDENLVRVENATWSGDNIISDNGEYLTVLGNAGETKTYTLTANGGAVRIAKFTVTFTNPQETGPSRTVLKSDYEMTNIYSRKAHIDFNYTNDSKKTTLSDGFTYYNQPLNAAESTYGFVYTQGALAQTASNDHHGFVRAANQGVFPFYGEYVLVNGVNKSWGSAGISAENHGGKDKGFALYVDGTTEPGLVVSISAPANICSGQTMYCSAWLCNPSNTAHQGSNPIFRFNVQGREKDENGNYGKWEDAGVFFVGELPKGSGWQQVVFPIESAQSYDSTRVMIYNFATSGAANDFLVDDISLFVSQLPIAAYQGKMACRSVDSKTSAAAVLRLDYSNIQAGSDGYIYYQIFNTNLEKAVNLTGDEAYYHEAHQGEHTDDDSYGSVHIPATNYNPEEKGETFYYSVSAFLDDLVSKGYKHGKAYVKTTNDGVTKWLLYVAHIIDNVTEEDMREKTEEEQKTLQLSKLYDAHKYTMRMAYSPLELPQAECNMQTPLHATQQTVFELRNSDGKIIQHELDTKTSQLVANQGDVTNIYTNSVENCANDLYFLTAKVVNHLAVNTGLTPDDVEAPIYADWLVSPAELDTIFENKEKTQEEKEQAFYDYYGYRPGEVASAVMYDMRRVPTDKDNNTNYNATSFKALNPSKFLNRENYNIIKHLHDNGWLQFRDTTIHFYLPSDAVASYWCFPIEGTAKTTIDGAEYTLKDCNEPRRIRVTSASSVHMLNIAPMTNVKKTSVQKTQIPLVKVLADQLTNVEIPIMESTQTQTLGLSSGEITINLKSMGTDVTFFDLETGTPINTTPALSPGTEHTIRLLMKNKLGNIHINGEENACRVGYVFATIQILPDTLVWTPAESSFNGWGKDENWKGWNDKNADGVIDNSELTEGYVPISGANVIIPKLANTLLYPYIVPEHTHNHYPMTINFQPHHCNNIYFAPGTHIYNQHLLEYEKAFVDMQFPAAKWHLVSAPLQGMVSGDMFIPHKGWWSSSTNNLVAEPNPFEVKAFNGEDYTGIRSGDAAYAFWQAFYNTDVDGSNKLLREFENIQFTQSNTLVQPLTEGTGYAVYGLGFDEDDSLTVRLPKPDEQYDYYTNGSPNGTKVNIPYTVEQRGKLAYTATHDNQQMTITLTNQNSGEYFLFGNPTMAFVDMHALYLDNKDRWNGEFRMMTNNIINAATPATLTPANRYLPPMTSALLKASSEVTQMNITLLPSHLTLNNVINPVDEVKEGENDPQQAPARRVAGIDERPINYEALQSELMTIYAFTPKGTARTVLATNPAANDYYTSGEDALFTSSGVENESYVTTPLNMYTVAEQVPMMADVRQGISEIPLAILAADKARAEHMQIAFYLSSNWSRECYFYDSQTGQRIRIMDGLVITIEMPQNHEQRYYIEGPDVYQGSSQGGVTTSTPANNTTTNPNLRAYSLHQGEVMVTASELMTGVKLYDIAGRLLAHETFDLLQNTATLSAPAGVCVVEAVLRDGTTLHTQTIVR